MTQLTHALQDNVLTALATSEQHAARLALQLTPELFSTRGYQKIAEASIEYIKKFGGPPRAHLRDLLEEDLRRGEDGILLARYIEEIDKLAPELQIDYVLSQLDIFIEARKLANAITIASDALHSGDLEAAKQALYVRPEQKVNGGIWLSDANAMLSFLQPREEDVFSSGIDLLDERGVRPARKQLFIIIGSKGIGKSWWLIQIGKHSLMHRRSVLHLTLELSEEETAKRYVQSLFALTTEEAKTIRVPIFQKDELGRCIKVDFDTRSPELLDLASRNKIAAKLTGLRRSKLLIKEFPARGVNVSQIRQYLDYLDRSEQFKPDVLVLDQAFNLRFDKRNIRLSMGDEILELRGLASERNMAVVSSWQGNRLTDKAKTVTTGMVAEDWSLGGTADTICTISRTQDEKDNGLARILVDKARMTRDSWLALISQSYATGQFALDSVYFSKYIAEEVDRITGTDNEDE